MTYQEAETILANNKRDKSQKKLENNTVLVRLDLERIAIRLHSTNVVTLHADGSYTLNSGGWRTVTTRDRINKYSSGFGVSQNRFNWYVMGTYKGGDHNIYKIEFFDGITFKGDKCLNAPATANV